jgi:muconate cycloisomerase
MTEIASVDVFPIEIPFRTPFLLSRGYVGAPGRPGQHVYLKLTTKSGEVGWGESRPMPTWSYETMETVCSTLRKHVAGLLIGEDCSSVRAVRARIDSAITPSVSTSQPFAISAVEQALFDLLGREAGLPLHRILGGKLCDRMELCYMISGHGESLAEQATEMRRKGYTCFKIKIGGDPAKDAQRIGEVSEAVGEARVWADANQAYDAATVRTLIDKVADLSNVVCLEQPVPTYDYFGLQRVCASSRMPIAVDESVFTHRDMLRTQSMRACDMVVLKTAKSGILTTQKIANVAESAGIPLLGSGMTESGVGFAASIHAFSTLPMLLPVDTNGPQFLTDLLVDGIQINEPYVQVPDGPGLGVEVDEAKLVEFGVDVVL